jgi:hypothetical protein
MWHIKTPQVHASLRSSLVAGHKAMARQFPRLRDIPVQNIQAAGIFQYKLFSQ